MTEDFTLCDNIESMNHALSRLTAIMEQLRAPNGCPWDQKQNHASIKNYLIEEVYEVIDAIEDNDMTHLKEELGDLLFQIIFHCQMAKEQQLFTVEDVINDVCDKMVRRHPHVFKESPTNDVDFVLKQWDAIKKEEAQHKDRSSVFDGIPKHMPALFKAWKSIKKAKDVPQHNHPSEAETMAQIDTLWQKMKSSPASSEQETRSIMGQLLFQMSQLCHEKHIQPEEVLRQEIDRFHENVRDIEKQN